MPSEPHSTSTLSYRLILWASYPLAFAFTFYLAAKNQDWRYFFQRLGFAYPQRSSGSIAWIHCASVGEVKTITPLLLRFADQFPQLHFVVTTHTHTGAEIVSQLNKQRFTHVYCPLDYRYASRRFLRACAPKAAIFMETEIWPNLILMLANQGIPLSIINGRVSHKTLKAPSFVLRNYQRALATVTDIFAQSDEDRERFIALGAKTQNLKTASNLKYANASNPPKTHNNPLSSPFVLCASTHEDEEIQIAKAWIKNRIIEHQLVIAPRHPNRIKEICRQFDQAAIRHTLHSQASDQSEIEDVYLIDQIGVLEPFFQHAELVFVGGSLVAKGGHNILEPARYAKCILSGPHYGNFADITRRFADQRALIIADNSA